MFAQKHYDEKRLWSVSGYHADTPITIKAEAIRKADSRSH